MGKVYNTQYALGNEDRKDLPPPDISIGDALADLRHFVDNLNKLPALAFRNGSYKGFDHKQVQTVKVDGWEFGYQLKDLGMGIMQRRIFIKSLGQKIGEIPDEQIDPILVSVFEVCIEISEDVPEMEEIAGDCLLITQNFMPLFWHEKNPNVVVPGAL